MSHDTAVHRLVRPLVRPLAQTPVRPDHLTVLRGVTGVAAGVLFALGGPRALAAGGVAFILSFLLDRADGELARLTRRFSTGGHRWDLVADCGADVLCFVGLGIGARHGRLGGWAVPLGLLAAVSVVVLFTRLHGADGRARRRNPERRRRMDPDDAILAVPLLVWTVGPAFVLVLAGVLTPLAALGTVMALRPRRAGA